MAHDKMRYTFDTKEQQFAVGEGEFKAIAKLVNTYIKDFRESALLQQMKIGQAYFDQRNIEIFKKSKKFYSSEKNQTFVDPYKANNQLASNFSKLQTKQKVGYLINEDLVINSDSIDLINARTKNLKKRIKSVATEASKKAVGYLMPLIKKEGGVSVLNFKLMNSEQIIPIPDVDDEESFSTYIRFYSDVVIDDRGKQIKITRAEYWDDQYVWSFTATAKAKTFKKDQYIPMNPKPHINTVVKYGESINVKDSNAWGKAPLCRLNNNDELSTDTYPIKRFIDAYDVMTSDFANNLEDFQDVYWVLKNYGGENADEVIAQIKKDRVIATGENGDATPQTIQIPTEARKIILELLEQLIWKYGMGLDYDNVKGTPTATQIRFMFANLRLKANDFEIELHELWEQMVYFINKFIKIENITKLSDIPTIKFVKSNFDDTVAVLKANTEQIGAVDEETRLTNHPWVGEKRVKEVMKKMAIERGEIQLSDPLLGDIEDDEEDEDGDE